MRRKLFITQKNEVGKRPQFVFFSKKKMRAMEIVVMFWTALVAAQLVLLLAFFAGREQASKRGLSLQPLIKGGW